MVLVYLPVHYKAALAALEQSYGSHSSSDALWNGMVNVYRWQALSKHNKKQTVGINPGIVSYLNHISNTALSSEY